MSAIAPVEVYGSSKGSAWVEGKRGEYVVRYYGAKSCDVDRPDKAAKCRTMVQVRGWARKHLGTVRKAENPGIDWDDMRADGRRAGVIYAARKSGREPAFRTLLSLSRKAVEQKAGKGGIKDRAFKEMVWRTGFKEGYRDGKAQLAQNPRKKKSDLLRDMDRPTVLGAYELDRETLTPKRGKIDVTTPGDWGADPIGERGGKFMFQMVPSGDIVDNAEKERRLRKRRNPDYATGNIKFSELKKGSRFIGPRGDEMRVTRIKKLGSKRGVYYEDALRGGFEMGPEIGYMNAATSWRAVGKRNPDGSQASVDSRRLYQEFHGTGSTQTVEVRTPVKSRTDLTELGTLTEIKVVTVAGKRRFTIPFPEKGPDSVMLCSSPDGHQLYFEAGDQTIDLDQLNMSGAKWMRDFMMIGVLAQVTYRTEKGFDHFELTDYWHKLGEETGVQPWLTYDTINGLMGVYGGQYEVRPEGIVN